LGRGDSALPLTITSLIDDNGTPGNTVDDFSPVGVLSGGFNVGDVNHNGKVDFGEVWLFTSTGATTQPLKAVLGTTTNTATVIATNGRPVSAPHIAVGNRQQH